MGEGVPHLPCPPAWLSTSVPSSQGLAPQLLPHRSPGLARKPAGSDWGCPCLPHQDLPMDVMPV